MNEAPLRVALTALGCKVNYAEMAELAGRLAAAGCDVVPDDEAADVRVLNSCTVTLQADATTRQRLRRLRRADPGAHIVLTGCSVDGNRSTYERVDEHGRPAPPAGIDAVFDNAHKEQVAEHVIALAGSRRRADAPGSPPPLRSRAFIKAQDGCNHRCTYCSVWSARGASRSVPLDDVVAQARAAADAGHAELVLTGVDLGGWGREHGGTLAELVHAVLDSVGDDARLRLSSVNANDVTRDLIALNAHPGLCAHWHMPLQSGSDAVLRAMHRGYRRAQYLRVCAELRERDPDTEFTTDVMVAFPGETAEDHARTLELIEEAGMLAAHVFRYSPRPGTPAAALDDRVPDALARRRSAEVRAAAAASGQRRRARALGRRERVVWDRCEDGQAHGFTAGYLPVVAPSGPSTTPGRAATVEIVGVEGDALQARLVAP